jgi:hypothetical protein
MTEINTHCVVHVPSLTGKLLMRVRFQANATDYRPVEWPVKHPYWCTGYGSTAGGEHAIVVAYVEDEADIKRNWPEAADITFSQTDAETYTFTDRFQPPDWINEKFGFTNIRELDHTDPEDVTARWKEVVATYGKSRDIKLVYHPTQQV